MLIHDKPIHPDITWTVGLLNGRGYYCDLQIQGLALASSIIINEPVVPKIIIAWDTPNDSTTLSQNVNKKLDQYPRIMINAFDRTTASEKIATEKFGDNFNFENKYVKLVRSWLSVNPQQWSLGLGYRSKYLGINYVTTKYGIISDVDTVCIKPCIEKLMNGVYESPDTFCFTGWHNETWVTVGLCIYNMFKYRNFFFPYLCNEAWTLPRQDSRFIKTIIDRNPQLKDILDIKTFDGKLSAEKLSTNTRRNNIWDEERTMHYHAWKGETRKNPTEFFKIYNKILDDLKTSAISQLK
jgi:hypothetical protein